MIKNIVFDMGQVLIHYEPPFFIDRLGITDPADKRLLLREVFVTTEWSRLDRGSLDYAQAEALMQKSVPERLWYAVKALVEDWSDPIIPMEGVADIVKELKENGYRIYLLSNANLHLREYFPNIPGSEYFDGLMVSAEELLVKPQPEIYRRLCERFDLIPDECVFIDDSTPNTEGAYTCGIHPIVFHQDADELRQRLSELGVNISVR